MNLVHKLCLSGIALLWIGQTSLVGQIVNIEKRRIQTDSAGWFGSARVAFAGSKNTKETLSFSTGTLIEYKSKSTKDLWLFISDLSLITGNQEKFSNAGFGHLRYNRKVGESIRWEAFTQIQYNSLVKVDRRVLFGTGPRFKLTQLDNAKFYLGIAYMYEEEDLIEPIVVQKNHRMSSYFSFTLLPDSEVTFVSTTYVQPLLTDPKDYRLSNETSLDLGITKKLILSIAFRYGYDSMPPVGVPKSTYAFANTIEVEF
jgi:putative salt-induced outer membrane protein YdiY